MTLFSPVPGEPLAVIAAVSWRPDGVPRILLQVGPGFLLMGSASARKIAAGLLNVADELDEILDPADDV